MIYGLDVSNYQPERFPLELSDGTPVDFVIIQVTRGMVGVNEKWIGQLAWARQHDLAVGFYHFGTIESPDAQARRFSDMVEPFLLPGDSLWYDWEASGTPRTAPTNEQKDQFIKELKLLRPKKKVGLYCNVDFWKNRDTTDYCGDALWIASWSTTGVGLVDPPIEHPWVIHQYDDGPVVDHDRAKFGHREDMKVWGGKPPSDTELIARAVARLEAAVRDQAFLWTARFDTLKASLDRLEVAVMELEGDDLEAKRVASQVVDELARRLES